MDSDGGMTGWFPLETPVSSRRAKKSSTSLLDSECSKSAGSRRRCSVYDGALMRLSPIAGSCLVAALALRPSRASADETVQIGIECWALPSEDQASFEARAR